MGLLSACFGPRGDNKNLSAEVARPPQRSASDSNIPGVRVGLPCRPDGSIGIVLSVYVTPANDLVAMQCDHVSGQVVAVRKEDVARAQSYNYARLLESFERWGKAPVEVQQEVERAVRESEIKYGANAK